MKVLVLKPFPYAADGINPTQLEEGDEPEVRDELVAGLEQEGFIVVGLPAPEGHDLLTQKAARKSRRDAGADG